MNFNLKTWTNNCNSHESRYLIGMLDSWDECEVYGNSESRALIHMSHKNVIGKSKSRDLTHPKRKSKSGGNILQKWFTAAILIHIE